MQTTKLKIGFYGITGCAGCQLSVIFQEDDLLDLLELVDIRSWPFIKEHNDTEKLDYIFMEGLVADEEDKETLLRAREQATHLVALGACAHTGCVPAYRHFTLKENYAHLLYEKTERVKDLQPSPISTFVKVDYLIPGCPPDKQEIREFIKSVVLGKEPRPYNNPVCVECRQNNTACLLDKGKPCLGPVTRGGCHAVCTTGGLECWGCRGPTTDANIEVLIDVLRAQGHSDKAIKDRILTFAGTQYPDIRRIIHDKRKR